MPLFQNRHAAVLLALAAALPAFAQTAATPKAEPDSITFTNGDHLTGKFVREAGGSVTFQSDIAGAVTVPWAKIKDLHTSQTVAVIKTGVVPNRHDSVKAPIGNLKLVADKIELESPQTHEVIASIPVANAQYIVDQTTYQKQLFGHPGLLEGWSGSATGGVTLVQATQNQYTVTAAAALQRVVPSADWLNPRNKTSLAFNESYGKISEPAYTTPATATTPAAFVPGTFTKSNILLANFERDQYVSPRFYYLGTAVWTHNFSQSLGLQQVYGGGVGYTVIKKPKQMLDVKAIAQYEKQTFFDTETSNQNLIAATFSGEYTATMTKGIIFDQQVSYIPAFNNVHAYSATETDTLTFPTYKSLGFTIGTIDSYLNDAPVTLPATKRNSFQFTMGVTYAIKSKY